jgi:hypothetical protein
LLAIAENASTNGVYVLFDIPLLNILTKVAKAALERSWALRWIVGFRRRKFHGPELKILIDECDAVDIAAGFAANLANETNFCFGGGTGHAQGQDFVGSEDVARNDSGAVAAEDNGFRLLREHLSCRAGSKKHDGDFFGNAPTSANLMHRTAGTRSPVREKPTLVIGRRMGNFRKILKIPHAWCPELYRLEFIWLGEEESRGIWDGQALEREGNV